MSTRDRQIIRAAAAGDSPGILRLTAIGTLPGLRVHLQPAHSARAGGGSRHIPHVLRPA